jgi:hypothetical protein
VERGVYYGFQTLMQLFFLKKVNYLV